MDDKNKEIRILQRQLKTTRLLNNTLRDTIARQEKTIEQLKDKYIKIGEEKEKLRRKQEMEQKKLEQDRKRAEKARQAASRAKHEARQNHLALGDVNLENYLDVLGRVLKYLSPADGIEMLNAWLVVHDGNRTNFDRLINSIEKFDNLFYKGIYKPAKGHTGDMSKDYQEINDLMKAPEHITKQEREKLFQKIQALKKKYDDGDCDGLNFFWELGNLGRLQFVPVKHMLYLLKKFQIVAQDSQERSLFSWAGATKQSMMKTIQSLLVTDESNELNYTAIRKELSEMFLTGTACLLNASDPFLKEMWTKVHNATLANGDSKYVD